MRVNVYLNLTHARTLAATTAGLLLTLSTSNKIELKISNLNISTTFNLKFEFYGEHLMHAQGALMVLVAVFGNQSLQP